MMISWQVRAYLDNWEAGKPRDNQVVHVAALSPVFAAQYMWTMLTTDDRKRLHEIEVTKDHDLAAIMDGEDGHA